MTNGELIQTIRNEIEKQIKDPQEHCYGISSVNKLKELLSFLDTLEKSETPMNQEGLEEEIHKYNKERFDEYFPEQDGDFISEVDFMTCLDRVARHFYELGKQSGYSEIPNDMEEAADEYAEKHGFRVPYDGSEKFYDDVDVKASKEGFIAGAKWGIKSQEKKIADAYEKGKQEGIRVVRSWESSPGQGGY